MKARTKLQKHVQRLGLGLPALSEAKRRWACGLFPAEGLYLKRGEVWCQRCGYIDRVPLPSLAVSLEVGHTCPGCGATLTLKHHDAKRETTKELHVSFIQRVPGWTVIRTFSAQRANRRGEPTRYSVEELYRNWVDDRGREVVESRPYVRTVWNVAWRMGEPMQIARHNHSCNGAYDLADMFDPSGNFFYPRAYVSPLLRRNGWRAEFLTMGVPVVGAMRQLLTNPVAETVVKQGQADVFRHMLRRGDYQPPYMYALNICHRNGYVITDAQLWFDYMDLLAWFRLDTHNPRYVCPPALRAAHDRLLRKKDREEARRRAADRAKRMRLDEQRYARDKAAFIGLSFAGADGIAAHVLGSVEEFYREGEAMRHCVFTNEYYRRADSLILSATVGGKRMETVEVSLRTFRIVQSRAVCNGVSPYHARIINLVNQNMNLIKERKKQWKEQPNSTP